MSKNGSILFLEVPKLLGKTPNLQGNSSEGIMSRVVESMICIKIFRGFPPRMLGEKGLKVLPDHHGAG